MSTDRATAAATSRIARGLRNELDKHDTDRMNVPINICIAVAFLGLGCVAHMVLPWTATKFLCGIAGIAIVVCGALIYMRHESRKAAAAKAKTGAKHAS